MGKPALAKAEKQLKSIKSKAQGSAQGAKKAAKTAAKKSAPAASKNGKVVSKALTCTEADGRPEPPYSAEMHVKKAQCIVHVTLHHVPPTCIDISATSGRHLIVDCSKYTKKYYLDFEIPHKMAINPETAEYEFENGILKCVLTSDTGVAPEGAKQERAAFVSKVTSGKHLRFTKTADGEVVVRHRHTGLVFDHSAQKKQSKEAPATAPSTGLPSVPAAAKKQTLSDTQVLAVAEAVGKATKASTSSKAATTKVKAARQQQTQNTREDKKVARKTKETGSFKRIIEEQRRRLSDRIAAAKPQPRSTSSKKVAFAAKQ